jgi:cytochrome P450
VKEYDIDLMNDPMRLGVSFLDKLDQIREQDPVFWSEQSGCWLVSRFADVSEGFQGNFPLQNAGRVEYVMSAIPVEERERRFPHFVNNVRHGIVSLDAPEHTRIRKLMMQAFNKKIVENLRPYVRERVNFLLDKAEASPLIEFNEEIARPLPGFVLFKLLGIPEDQFANLRDWSNAVIEGTTVPNPSIEKLEKTEWATREMNRVIVAELDKRRSDPRDDLITKLLNASDEGDRLSQDELLASMDVLIVAGHDTTSNTMTMGIEALSRQPHAWQYLYEHPDRTLNCINELMRYVSMSTTQPRIVSEDFKWHGKHLKKGQMVFLSIAGANRDPRVFPNPDKLDFERDTTQSQVFAPGIHHCIGHLLAKMQLVEFFSALVQRFEKVDILDDPLNFMPAAIFRGMYNMNAHFYPRG